MQQLVKRTDWNESFVQFALFMCGLPEFKAGNLQIGLTTEDG